jgi:hypothetical protein
MIGLCFMLHVGEVAGAEGDVEIGTMGTSATESAERSLALTASASRTAPGLFANGSATLRFPELGAPNAELSLSSVTRVRRARRAAAGAGCVVRDHDRLEPERRRAAGARSHGMNSRRMTIMQKNEPTQRARHTGAALVALVASAALGCPQRRRHQRRAERERRRRPLYLIPTARRCIAWKGRAIPCACSRSRELVPVRSHSLVPRSAGANGHDADAPMDSPGG